MVYDHYLAIFHARIHEPYVWSDEQIKLWREYFGSNWVIDHAPTEADVVNGTYYVYRHLTRPRSRFQPFLLHLPGTESVIGAEYSRAAASNRTADLQSFRSLVMRKLPSVAQYMNLVGSLSTWMGDYSLAYRMFLPGIRAGMIDVWNLSRFGNAASKIGRADEALNAYERAVAVYPDRRTNMLAQALRVRFVIAVMQTAYDYDESEKTIREGLRQLADHPSGSNLKYEESMLRLARAGLHLAQGKNAEANAEFDDVKRCFRPVDGISLGALPAWLNRMSFKQ
jgi:tetratricopeptide (TPR) repeat protein